MKTLIKLLLITGVVVSGWLGGNVVRAGSLADLETTIKNSYTSGGITDPDLYDTLLSLVSKAKGAATVEEANVLRGSVSDVAQAFEGSGIASEAVANIVSAAQP